ncbi:MAG: hypothetical protein KJ721_00505 [Nanoarchaeota archaeon]|nr:hypothetical protein [Nanoarchaeota archaeon]
MVISEFITNYAHLRDGATATLLYRNEDFTFNEISSRKKKTLNVFYPTK